MAYLLRLIVGFLCVAASSFAVAAGEQCTMPASQIGGVYVYGEMGICSVSGARYRPPWSPTKGVISGSDIVCYGNSKQGDGSTIEVVMAYVPFSMRPCPVCPAGEELNKSTGKCEKKKDDVCGPLAGMGLGISSMESDFGPQSAKWAAGKLGKSGNACMNGCQTSGTISSCVAGTGKSSSTVCYLSNPSFTGVKCSEPSTGGSGGEGNEGGKDKPDDCPAGYEPSKFAPGVCIPKPNDCPSGSSPSKYVDGICIPDEKGDDGSCEDPKDPTKRAECEGKGNQCPSGQVQSTTQVNTCVPAKDGSDKGKDGSTVECKDGKCTVTKPDGTKEDKGQDEVCKQQPDLAMCKESKGQFSGSCSGNFRCDGDVLQCAALQEQHKRNCTIFDIENDMSRLFDVDAKKPQENVLTANGTEIDLKGHITVDSIIGNGQCPADVPLQVFGKTVVFKLSEFCRYFNAMGMLLFLSTCATCLRILGT